MAIAITIYRGNTETRTVTVTSGGAAFNMTNYTLKFVVKNSYSDLDAAAIINKAVTFSTPATGVGVLAFTHANTDISPGSYVCELKLYNAGGTFIKTLDLGSFNISNVVLKEI